MKWLAGIALVAGCGSRPDECTRIKDHVRPVLAAMARDAKKGAIPESIVAELCTEPKTDAERTMRTCLVEASSDATTAACLEPELEAYRDGIAGTRPAPVPAAAPIDAAISIDAAVLPPVDPATLATWPVTDRSRDVETEVIAVDAPADFLFSALWNKAPFLALASGKPVSGRVVAPSRNSAALAMLAAAGVARRPVAAHGSGTSVTFSFGGAPQRDLFRIIADVLHANLVVAPGALPDVDLVFDHVPVDGVLGALAALDDLTVTHAGKTIYLLPKGAVLPPLAKLPGGVVSLAADNATVQIATGALAAVSAFPPSCSTTAVSLRVTGVALAEAARALAIAAGEPLVPGDCPIAEAAVDPAKALLAAIATAGDKRAAIATVGGTPSLLRPSADVAIENRQLSVKGHEVTSHLDTFVPTERDYGMWRASIVRTVAVIRIGKAWRAVLELASGRAIPFDPTRHYELPDGLRAEEVEIGPSGVTITDPEGHEDLIPLRGK